MNAQVNTIAQDTTVIAVAPKGRAAYLVKRDSRTRFSFGPVWNAAVMEGNVTDKDKLVAQAVKLKAGRKYDLKKLRFETLLAKVQAALTTNA